MFFKYKNLFQIFPPPAVRQHNHLYNKEKDSLLQLSKDAFTLAIEEVISGLLDLINYEEAKKVQFLKLLSDFPDKIIYGICKFLRSPGWKIVSANSVILSVSLKLPLTIFSVHAKPAQRPVQRQIPGPQAF